MRYGHGVSLWLLAAVMLTSFMGNVAADEKAQDSASGANVPNPATESVTTSEGSGKDTEVVRGSFRAGIDAAKSSKSTDINLDQFLRFRITPPEYPKLHINGSLWLTEDLDGDENPRSVLRDINDQYDDSLRLRILTLNVEAEDVWGDSTLRIGRQRITESPLLNRIDGIYFQQTTGTFDWYVFAGARASLYRDTHKDQQGGAGLTWQLSTSTRLGLDFFIADEERRVRSERLLPNLLPFGYSREIQENVNDSYVALSLYQDITENVRLYARAMFYEKDFTEFLLDVTGWIPAPDLTWQFTYRRQLVQIEDKVSDLTQFYRVLGPGTQYHQIFATVHKPITERLMLSLEAEWRQAEGDKEGSLFITNRDYNREAVILTAQKLPYGLEASVSLERWDPDHADATWAISGEATKKWDKAAVTLGVDYERWRDTVVDYNPYPQWLRQGLALFGVLPYSAFTPLVYLTDTKEVAVRENVYSVYARVKYIIKPRQEVGATLSYEEDDGPESPYWRLKAFYEIRF